MKLSHQLLKSIAPDAYFLKSDVCDTVDYFFSVDSRTITKQELFVPVKGAHVDGHQFLSQALKNGAGALIAKKQLSYLNEVLLSVPQDALIIVCDNPELLFFELTSAWRARFTFPVVGITGSVGKTSTKALLARMLKDSGKNYFVAEGNQNTLIGVSLNIAHLNDSHEGALFECGISQPGEMARIAAQLQPTTGIITTIGHSHAEGIGNVDAIAIEKKALFKWFKETNIGIIQGDISSLSKCSYAHPVIRFGAKTINQVQVRRVTIDDEGVCSFILKLYGKQYPISVRNGHSGCVTIIAAAAAAAYYLGVSPEIIARVAQEPFLPERRFEKRMLKGYQGYIIDDAYIASPESMKTALLAFEKIKSLGGKKIAVLGDMLELGQSSPFWHRQIGRFLRKVPSLTKLILVGNQVQWIRKTVPLHVSVDVVDTWQDALGVLESNLNDGDIVLVKGSNGMNLGKLVDACC